MAMSKPHYQTNRPLLTVEEGRPLTVQPQDLNIIWGNDERYWRVPKGEGGGPAELIQVCWLEVTGAVKIIAGKQYQISFEVELAPDAFGWRDIQAFLMAKVGKKGKYKWTKVKLAQEPNADKKFTVPDSPFIITNDAVNDSSDNTLHFGLYEVWSGKWKGGLKIHGARICQLN